MDKNTPSSPSHSPSSPDASQTSTDTSTDGTASTTQPITIPEHAIQDANGGNRHCRVCGVATNPVNAICRTCGVDKNKLNTMISEPPETYPTTIIWVGGIGYGVHGAYSDTFHILTPDRTATECGRVSVNTGGSVNTGISWATPILTLRATTEWQSSLCGHCKRSEKFSHLDETVTECLEKDTVPVAQPDKWTPE